MVSSFYFLIVYPPRDSDISRLEGSIGPDNTVDDLVTLLYTADFFGSKERNRDGSEGEEENGVSVTRLYFSFC